MATNIEIKARVGNLSPLRERAARLSQTPGELLPQEDIFFGVPKGRLKLRFLGPARGELIYYEDYPYAEDAAKLAHVWGNDEWSPESIALSDEALRAKIDAFVQHRSQISTFYRNDEEVAQRIRAYAESIGQGRPVERFWRDARLMTITEGTTEIQLTIIARELGL